MAPMTARSGPLTRNAAGCLTAILKTLQKDSDVAAARVWLASDISISDPDQVDELEGLPVGEVAARCWIDHCPDGQHAHSDPENYRHAIELTPKWLCQASQQGLLCLL
jgi:hypothetical protein